MRWDCEVDKTIVNKMTADEIIIYKMSINKMTVDRMTSWIEYWQYDWRKHNIRWNDNKCIHLLWMILWMNVDKMTRQNICRQMTEDKMEIVKVTVHKKNKEEMTA